MITVFVVLGAITFWIMSKQNEALEKFWACSVIGGFIMLMLYFEMVT
jgi:lipid-A-disaccharide synthase-like uncharacterized protein